MNAIAPSSAPASGPALDNRRALAGLIDLGVVFVGAALLSTVVGIVTGGDAAWGPQMSLIALAWALYYYFALESGDGQTLGKKVMKLRVVRADGGATGMREIAVRTLLRVVDGICLYLVGLVVMLATGNRRQRLGDIAAGTIVVDASSAPAPAAGVAAASPAAVAPPAHEDDVHERPADAPPMGEPSFPVAKSPVDVGGALPDMTAPERPSTPAVQDFNPFSDPTPAAEPQVEAPEPTDSPGVEAPVQAYPSEPAVEQQPEPADDAPVDDAPDYPSVEPAAEEPSFEPAAEEAPEPAPEEPSVESVEPAPDHPSVEPAADDSSVEPAAEQSPSYPAPAQDSAAEVQDAAAEADQEGDQMTVKSMETVSAMDLIMGDDGEDDDSSSSQQGDGPAGA